MKFDSETFEKLDNESKFIIIRLSNRKYTLTQGIFICGRVICDLINTHSESTDRRGLVDSICEQMYTMIEK